MCSPRRAAYSSAMSVLVGIPTHKRPELLRQCLDSIAAQAGDLPPVRVFVADNDAKGQEGVGVVEEMAAAYRFQIASTSVAEPGISAVRNAILEEARRGGDDFIAMIDDDETASPEWLLTLLKVQAEFGADVVGGPTIWKAPPSAPLWLQTPEAFGTRTRDTGLIDVIDATGNVMMAGASLARAGWPQFDLQFGLSGGGDTEFFLRLRKAGLRFAWAGDARVEEVVPLARHNAWWFLRRQFRYGNTGYRLSRLHVVDLTPGPAWALKHLIASPFWVALALYPPARIKALKRLGYSAGIMSSALGYRFLEYGERHGDKVASANSSSCPDGT